MRDATINLTDTILIACALTEPELSARKRQIAGDLVEAVNKVVELDHGYAVRFKETRDPVTEGLRFISFGRQCCPFFTFEIFWEAGQQESWLKTRGPEGVKVFIREMSGGIVGETQ